MNGMQEIENGEEESDSEEMLHDCNTFCSVSLTRGFLNGHDYHKVNDKFVLGRKINATIDSNETYHDKQCWNSNESKRKRIDLGGKFNSTSRELNYNNLRRTRKMSREELPELNDELLNGYKILQHLMSPTNKNVNSLFMDRIDAVKQFSDYCDRAREPMWLNKVRAQLLSGKYNSVTEVVHDVRQILENCYDYYGQNHSVSKRALKLELMLEQKLALLPREMREKTILEATSPLLIKAAGNLLSGTRPPAASSDTSQILFYVTNSKLWKEKSNRKKHLEEKKAVKEANYVNVIEWEKQLTQEHLTTMKAMWELPQIGHFLFLAQSALNIPELHMYELERIFLMPRESRYLAVIVTSLLSTPFQRTKLHQKPPMPYRVWKERVKLRVDSWYKLFYNRKNSEKVFKAYGIEPDFFRILGEFNPLEEKEFHELSFHQRVWIVKSLCDYCLHTHKTVQDAINENSLVDQKEFVLGTDRNGKSYVHFPQFCGQDLRIYCQSTCNELPVSNFLSHAKSILNCKTEISNGIKKLDVKNGDFKAIRRKANKKYKSVQPDIKKFELIVDGVDSLRQLISKFSISKDMLTSKNLRKKEKQEQLRCELDLCERLYNLLDELERWESKLQNVVKRTQMRLKQEFDDYQTMSLTGEEDVDDIWGTEPDEEVQFLIDSPCGDISISEDDLSISLYDSDSSIKQIDSLGQRRCRAKRKRCNVPSEDENESSSDFEMSISSRGRLRKTRKINIDECDYLVKTRTGNQNYKSSNAVSECHISKDYISNSTHEAKGQYEWETLRQIIISSSRSETNKVPFLPNKVGQTKENLNRSHHDESSEKVSIEQKRGAICQQGKIDESDINCQEETVPLESNVDCQQNSVAEESDQTFNKQNPSEEQDGNFHRENLKEKTSVNSCQQDITKESDISLQSSDFQDYTEIPIIQNNIEIDAQSPIEIDKQSSEIYLQDTLISEENIKIHPPPEKRATSTIEAQHATEIICSDNPNPSKVASQQTVFNDSKSVKLLSSRPVSRLKSSGLFLHIPPREVLCGTEHAISNNAVNKQVASIAFDKNSTTKESDKVHELLVTKNKSVDQTVNKVKSKRIGKGPQNYQVFNFKLPSKPSPTSPKLDRLLLQPASNQLNSVKHLIPAVDQKGNKIFLQYVASMPIQANSNENKQDVQKTQSPLVLNMHAAPSNTRIVLSNNVNLSSGNIPLLLPVKHCEVNKVSSLTTLPIQKNLTNNVSNVLLSSSGCASQEKSSISLPPLNTQSQTVLPNPLSVNTAVIPHIFQQNNNANSPASNAHLFLKVAQNAQNSATISLVPQLKSPTSSTAVDTAKTVPTTSHSVRLKSGPPPLGPITSMRKPSAVLPSPNRSTTPKESHSISAGFEKTKNTSLLQLPPLGPITSPTSKLKNPNGDVIKGNLLSQTPVTSVKLSNSIGCSQAVTKVNSTLTTNNNHFNTCAASSIAAKNVASSKTPVKLTVSPAIPNNNYQFIMTPPSPTVPPTQVILSCNNIPAASASTSNSVFFLPPTAKPQTVIAAAPTITVPAGGNSNRTIPNILTKQPSKTLAKTPVLLANNSSVFNLSPNLSCEKDGIRKVNSATVINSTPNNANIVISTKKEGTNSVQYSPQHLFVLTSNGQLMQVNKVDTSTGNKIVSSNESHSTQQNVSFVLSPLTSQALGSMTELKDM